MAQRAFNRLHAWPALRALHYLSAHAHDAQGDTARRNTAAEAFLHADEMCSKGNAASPLAGGKLFDLGAVSELLLGGGVN